MKTLQSLRSKMVFAALIIALLFLLIAHFGIMGMNQIASLSNRLHTDYIPVIESSNFAALAILDEIEIIHYSIEHVREPQDFDEVRKYESLFKQAMLNFDMYTKAVVFGSESDAFAKSSGGLTKAMWAREGLQGKFIVVQVPVEMRERIEKVRIHHDKFSGFALKTMKSHKKALRLELAKRGEEAAVEFKKSAEYGKKADEYSKLIENDLSMLDHDLRAFLLETTLSIESNQRSIVAAVTTVSIISFILVLLFSFVATDRLIVRPIRTLTQGVSRIAKGELDFNVELESSDEFAELAQVFNKMTKDLATSTKKEQEKTEELTALAYELSRAKEELEDFSSNLEQKVAEKTKDLKDSQVATLNIMEDLQEAYAKLKNAQFQLIQAEKMSAMGVLASGIAHEVKNPLGIIIQATNYLEGVMSGEQKDLRELNNVVAMIRDSVFRADGIIRDLLDYSRVTALTLKPEDVNVILDDSLNLVKHIKEFKRVEVVAEKGPNLPKVLVDKNKLQQVFINLFSNALHAMVNSDQKKLVYRSYATKFVDIQPRVGRRVGDIFKLGEIVVKVKIQDTGSGISSENIKKVFDPFFSTKGPRQGAGLGLSICANIIDLHKGLIEIDSQKNKGTKFIITLKTEEGRKNG